MPHGTVTEPQYGSLATAAARYDISPRTLRRLVADGTIKGYRLGSRLLRVDLAEVEAALRQIPTTDGPQ